MAMMNLRVNQGPTLNLSSIFKAAAGDPDTVAKLELAKSKIWNDYYDNLYKQQQTEYARQQGLQEAQKTADLQKLATVKEGAVPGITQGLVGAIPKPADQPVPVELSRIAGPVNGVPVTAPPSIVDTNYYNDQVAAAKARGSMFPYIVKDATDAATGYGKDIGMETLTAGLTPGGPAAVRTTPDQLRLAGELYTGNAPTTTTMVTSADTAPGIFATQDAAGKELAKAGVPETKVVNGVLVRGTPGGGAYVPVEGAPQRPLGDAELALARQELARIESTPTAKQTPQDIHLYPLLKAEVDKADRTILGEKQRLVESDPAQSGAVQDVPGSAGPPGAPSDFSSTGIEADYNRNVLRLRAKQRAGKPLTPEEQDLLAVSFNGLYGEKWEQHEDSSGKLRWIRVRAGAPAGFTATGGADVTAAPPPVTTGPAGPAHLVPGTNVVIPPGAVPPVAAATAAAVSTAPVVPVATDPDGNPAPIDTGDVVAGFDQTKPLTEGAAKDARLVPLLMIAYSHIKEFPPDQLPNAFWQVWSDPGSTPSTIANYIASMADGPAKQYAQMLNQFTLNLYLLSGAAFPGAERPQNVKTFIPVLYDDAKTRAQKFEAMGNLINSIQNNAFALDPDRRHKFQKDAHDIYHVDLNDRDVAPPQIDPYASSVEGGTPAPAAAATPATPTTFADGKPLTPVPQGVGIDPANWPNFDAAGRADAYKLYDMMKAKGLVK